MHGSELDAAWYELKDYMPPTLRAEYASALRVSNTPIGEVGASGAAMVGETKGKEDALMPTRSLYEVAMLVTGKWGHNALPKLSERASSDRLAPAAKAFEPQVTKGVFEDMQYVPTQYMNFWERMEALNTRFDELIKSLKVGYARKAVTEAAKAAAKKAKEAAKRLEEEQLLEDSDEEDIDPDSSENSPTPWLHACERMQQAVKFCLDQRKLRPEQRSIFGSWTMQDARTGAVETTKLMPLGMKISVLKADGNSKLPFIAYSELPMSTCPGAGDCGVYQKDASSGSIVGWCYSFKAWRYPDAFKRQFLNTLANYADREFSILRRNGDNPADGSDRYWERVNAGMPQGAPRDWMSYVASLALITAAKIVYTDVKKKKLDQNERNGGRTVFLRLFVDGDIGQPDSIHSWMLAVRQMADAGMRAEAASRYGTKAEPMNPRWFAPMQVYGYSKCWGELVSLDSNGRYQWPENYTLNLSSGSIYAKDPSISQAVQLLPISRGGFNAIDFRQHLQSLKGIKPDEITMPKEPPLPGVSEEQLRGIVAIEDIRYDLDERGVPVPGSAEAKAIELLDKYFGVSSVNASKVRTTTTIPKTSKGKNAAYLLPEDDKARQSYLKEFSEKAELEVRKKTLIIALNRMVTDPNLSEVLKREIARDNGYVSVAAFRAALEAKFKKSTEAYNRAVERYNAAIAAGQKMKKPKAPSFPKEAYEIPVKRGVSALSERQEKKLIALLVHAIFVASARSASGSCPLVCGNCADITVDEADEVFGSQVTFRDFQARTGAVHRCASRVPTAGYMPPPGKRLPAGVTVGPDGFTQPYYRRPSDGRTELVVVTGYYGAEIHIGLH